MQARPAPPALGTSPHLKFIVTTDDNGFPDVTTSFDIIDEHKTSSTCKATSVMLLSACNLSVCLLLLLRQRWINDPSEDTNGSLFLTRHGVGVWSTNKLNPVSHAMKLSAELQKLGRIFLGISRHGPHKCR